MTRSTITLRSFLEDTFGSDTLSQGPLQEVSRYISGLNYSSLNGFPPSDIYLTYIGSEDESGGKDNPENYEWHLDIALSGFSKDEISLEINEDTKQLHVYAKKSDSKEDAKNEEKRHYLHRKLSFRNLKLNYSIPFVKIKSHRASYENGVLSIVVTPEKKDNIKKVDIG